MLFKKALILLIGNICFVAMFIKATKILHNKLLDSILRGHIRFFDTTPIGRIVNRFTKDIEATEDSIPYSIKSLIECLLSMISTIAIISISTPLFLAALIPITAFYILVQVENFLYIYNIKNLIHMDFAQLICCCCCLEILCTVESSIKTVAISE